MTTARALLEAIAKADRGAADIYLADIGYEIGAQAAYALREEIAKALPAYCAGAAATLRRSLGRDYVSKAASGTSPFFDPDLLAAYNVLADNWELISKITVDEIEVNGTRFQVFRDEKGRFTRRGAKQPDFGDANAQANVLQRFNPPKYPSGAAGGSWRKKLPPGMDATKFKPHARGGPATLAFDDAVSDNDKKRLSEGLAAHRDINRTYDQLAGMGVLKGAPADQMADAAKLDVFVTVDGTGPGEQGIKIKLDRFATTSGGWALPPDYATGYKVTDIEVTTDDPEMQDRIGITRGDEVMSFNVDDLKRTGTPGNALDENKVRRQIRRLDMGGKLLTAVGAKKAGGAMRLSARLGGHLEDSELRTGMTRAAYRFRGIEAPQVSQDLLAAVEGPKPQDDGFREARISYYRQTGEPNAEGQVIASPEAIKMGQQRDYATLSLFGRMKKRESNAGMGINASTSTANYNKLAQDIAQGIGRGMPSEGVLIDRKGEIVSQSMGITQDSFTPFNAEALAKLNGGQYVRTRQMGGFTGEDLRTLLVGNGRAAQVLSNSGVYELELDPSLRGTRRYNDKVLQMVDTYDRVLDEISNGGHYAVPLPPEAEKAAKSRALQRAGNDQARYTKELKAARHEQYNKLAVVSPEEEKAVRDQVTPRAKAEFAQRFGSRTAEGKVVIQPGMTPKMDAYIESQVGSALDERQQEKARMLSLNSEGYALALKTLSQYYPYMVRTARYRSWEDFNDQAEGAVGNKRTATGNDAWATPAGYLRPKFSGEEGQTQARRGLPAKRVQTRTTGEGAERKTEVVQNPYNRITPGMSVAAAGGGGGGGGANQMPPEVKTMFDSRVKSLQEATRKDVAGIDNIIRVTDTGKAINDAAIDAAPEASTKARLFLAWYAQSPDKASEYLASPGGKDVRDAMQSPDVARNMTTSGADEPLTRKGQRMSPVEVGMVMNTIAATAAVQQYAGRIGTVESTISDNDIPEGDNPLMMADAGLSADSFKSRLGASRTMASSLDLYEQVTSAAGASPLDPHRPFKALAAAREKYAQASSGALGQPVADAVNNATNDVQRVQAMRQAGLFEDDQQGNDAAVMAGVLGKTGRQNVVNGQNDADFDMFRRKFNLGHGLWLQRQVNNLSASPGAGYDPKARGPLSGQVGKSDSRLLEYLVETLALPL